MQIGVIGLGKMGSRMAKKLSREKHEVVVWNRSPEPAQNVTQDAPSIIVASNIKDLVHKIKTPRVIWLMLPAGKPTATLLQEVSALVEQGDIIVDGSNAHYKDTEKRYQELSTKNIKFLGIGVSGGIVAETEGYPIMVGGNRSAYDYITPLLDSLSRPHGGHEYFGEGGAGHFVKMIHNGIEYGIMQSLAEGYEVLKTAPYSFDMLKVSQLWQKGTLVSGFMLDRAVDVFKSNLSLSGVSGAIGYSGEADWMVEQAQEQGVMVEIIEHALEYRKRSHTDDKIQQSFTAKMVNAFRNAFGGHSVKK